MKIRANKVLLCLDGIAADKILEKLKLFGHDEMRQMEPDADLIIVFKKDSVRVAKHRYGPTGDYEYIKD